MKALKTISYGLFFFSSTCLMLPEMFIYFGILVPLPELQSEIETIQNQGKYFVTFVGVIAMILTFFDVKEQQI